MTRPPFVLVPAPPAPFPPTLPRPYVPTPAIKPRDFKGTNYLPSTALNLSNALAMLDAVPPGGFYWQPYVEQEIGEIARVGFNNIRLHSGNFLCWLIDRNGFMRNLDHLARTCNHHGIVITYQFWTTGPETPAPLPYRDMLALIYPSWGSSFLHNYIIQSIVLENADARRRGRLVPAGEPGIPAYVPEPGEPITHDWPKLESAWPPNGAATKQLMLMYVREIAHFFANTPTGREAFGSYDLYNEPELIYELAPPNILILALCLPLIKDTYDAVIQVHPGAEVTVGFSTIHDRDRAFGDVRIKFYMSAFARLGVRLTYLSFHMDVNDMVQSLDIARRISQQNAGLPIVVSEFWHTQPDFDQTGRLGEILFRIFETQPKVGARIGTQMWGYLESNGWMTSAKAPNVLLPIDGIVRPILPSSLTQPLSFRVKHAYDYAALQVWLREVVRKPKPPRP